MDRSAITHTLLNAILSNQAAIVEAVTDLAQWADAQGCTPISSAITQQLEVIKRNEVIIGSCIGALMQGQAHEDQSSIDLRPLVPLRTENPLAGSGLTPP
jgi:hypothetical protein